MDSMFRRSFFGVSAAGVLASFGFSKPQPEREPYTWVSRILSDGKVMFEWHFIVGQNNYMDDDTPGATAKERAYNAASRYVSCDPTQTLEIFPLYR
jgi:hypothetical protein